MRYKELAGRVLSNKEFPHGVNKIFPLRADSPEQYLGLVSRYDGGLIITVPIVMVRESFLNSKPPYRHYLTRFEASTRKKFIIFDQHHPDLDEGGSGLEDLSLKGAISLSRAQWESYNLHLGCLGRLPIRVIGPIGNMRSEVYRAFDDFRKKNPENFVRK